MRPHLPIGVVRLLQKRRAGTLLNYHNRGTDEALRVGMSLEGMGASLTFYGSVYGSLPWYKSEAAAFL